MLLLGRLTDRFVGTSTSACYKKIIVINVRPRGRGSFTLLKFVNDKQFRSTIKLAVLTLTIRIVSCPQGKYRKHNHLTISLTFLPTKFANVFNP